MAAIWTGRIADWPGPRVFHQHLDNNDPAPEVPFIDVDSDVLAVIPSTDGPGYASIPAGYRFVISLLWENGTNNVNAVTFAAFDETGASLFAPDPVLVELTSPKDANGHPVTDADLAPILDIDFVVVGYSNGAATTALVSGAGVITYESPSSLTVLNTFPSCTNGQNTLESSNVTYGELDSAPRSVILQEFSVAFGAVGDPAALYATGANNQQHAFFRGTDGGIYNVFYDPAATAFTRRSDGRSARTRGALSGLLSAPPAAPPRHGGAGRRRHAGASARRMKRRLAACISSSCWIERW